MLQAGILQSIVDFQKSRQQPKLTLGDLEELTEIHPDLFGPPTHPLSSIVQSRLLARKQQRQQKQSAAAQALASRALVQDPDEDAHQLQQTDNVAEDDATDEGVTEAKKEPQASQDLAEMLFPETASTPASTSSAGQPQTQPQAGAMQAIEVGGLQQQAAAVREWDVVDTHALFKDLLP